MSVALTSSLFLSNLNTTFSLSSSSRFIYPDKTLTPRKISSNKISFTNMLNFSFSTIWKGWLWLRGGTEVREAGAQRPGFASANWAFPYHYHTFSYIPYSLACICLLFGISLSFSYIPYSWASIVFVFIFYPVFTFHIH